MLRVRMAGFESHSPLSHKSKPLSASGSPRESGMMAFSEH